MDELLLTDEEIARALEGITMFKKYNLSDAITPSDRAVAKAQHAKDEKHLNQKIEEAKVRGLEAGKVLGRKDERERIGFGLRQLQTEAREWSERNFPDGKPYQPFFGIVEEIGELAHAHLKREQGIRTDENHYEKQKDAIGDIVVFLSDYCSRNGFDLEECVRTVWAEVKERDWQALKGEQ